MGNPTNGLGGFLWYGTNAWSVTNDPQVQIPTAALFNDQIFHGLLINTSAGFFRSLIPDASTSGYLRTDGDGFYIQDTNGIPVTVPDPLTLTTLNASDVNTTTLDVSGATTFTGVNSDTVVSFLGLNGANQLVKGSVQTSSVAEFYENNSRTSPATPNFTYPSGPTANVQIGNEIYDPNNIAHVVSQELVEVDVAGQYSIEWYGQYSGYNYNGSNSIGTSYRPGLELTINNGVVGRGNIQVYQDRNVGGLAYGKVTVPLNVGDSLRLRGNGSMRSNADPGGTGLLGVTLILTKFA
jgi:hypothetical protein